MSKRTRMSVAAIVTAVAAMMSLGVATPADAARTASVRPVGCC